MEYYIAQLVWKALGRCAAEGFIMIKMIIMILIRTIIVVVGTPLPWLVTSCPTS